MKKRIRIKEITGIAVAKGDDGTPLMDIIQDLAGREFEAEELFDSEGRLKSYYFEFRQASCVAAPDSITLP